MSTLIQFILDIVFGDDEDQDPIECDTSCEEEAEE